MHCPGWSQDVNSHCGVILHNPPANHSHLSPHEIQTQASPGWGSPSRCEYATSSDGENWNKQGVVIEEGSSGELDDAGVYTGCILKEGGIYKLWYGGNDGSSIRCLFATSEDGVNWEKQGTVIDVGGAGSSDDERVWTRTILNENLGWWVDSSSVQSFIKKSNELIKNKLLLKEKGWLSRNFLINNYSARKTMNQILEQVCKNENN